MRLDGMRVGLHKIDSGTLQEPSWTNQEYSRKAVERPEVVELNESDD